MVLVGRGFLRLPSGSCYGNSSAGEEASVSIPPAARCPCPSWTWEWTGAQCRLPLGLRSNRAMMILQCAPPPPGSSVSSDMSTGLKRPLSPFPQGAIEPDRGLQLLRGEQGKASLGRALGEALQGLHQGHLAFSHSSCESLTLTFVWKLGERLVADVRFRVDGAFPASRPLHPDSPRLLPMAIASWPHSSLLLLSLFGSGLPSSTNLRTAHWPPSTSPACRG